MNDTELSNYLYKILRKEAFDGTGLIYGMGHAVYTLSDPRATLLKKKSGKFGKKTVSMKQSLSSSPTLSV